MPLHIKKLLLSDYSSWQRLFSRYIPFRCNDCRCVNDWRIQSDSGRIYFSLLCRLCLVRVFLKAAKYILAGIAMTGGEALILLVGTVVAFIVSVFVIKFLMGYIKKHDFKVFGWYRIILGILVILILR